MIAIHLDTVSVVFAVLGLFILVFGLVSMPIKEWLYLSEALVATIFGIIMGPAVSGLINVDQWGDVDLITREYSRIVIAISVVAVGISLPKAYLVKKWRSLATLLLPVMLVMWLVSAGIIYAFLPITFLEAMVIAACITPTDPVLANSVVKGRFAEQYVPDHVRNIISAESGANDGLGFPYLFFALYLIRYSNPFDAIGKWVYEIILYQIVLSFIIGALVGYGARKLLYLAQSRELIDKESFLAFSFALTMFVMGTVYIIGSDDLLPCLSPVIHSLGSNDWFRSETQEAHLQEVAFSTAHEQVAVWHLVVISILLLLFRRLPAVLALQWFIPALKTWREAAFAGWFGPMGVGALFFSTLAIEKMDEDNYQGNGLPVFQLSTSNLTRTLTNPAAIAHLVQRLPLIRPGQEIVIRRTDNTTEVTISRPTSMYQQDTTGNDEITMSQTTSSHQHASGNAVAARRSKELLRRQSHLSQHSVATRHSMRSGDDERLSITELDVEHSGSIEIVTVRNTADNAK
ncbi:Sodium/hydrogen exchanger family-domain-containing protein [Syncephalis plumigaleata]|nr:Sodium/hydrogen exchanger family-domain-containing protein [Syncephalis plumigaleata]